MLWPKLSNRQKATHEAGHAVMGYLSRWSIEAVAVDDEGGYTRFKGGLRPDAPSSGAVGAAGMAAEELFDYQPSKSDKDLLFLRDVENHLRGEEREEIDWQAIRKHINAAKQELQRHRPALAAVTAALEQSGTLTGAQAESIIEAASQFSQGGFA